MEDLSCGICFDDVSDDMRGYLSKCDHCFHYDCILKWASVTNLCPACKQDFRSVARKNEKGKTVHLESVKKTIQTHEEDEEEDRAQLVSLSMRTYCSICGGDDRPDDLLLCNAQDCSTACHIDCIGLTSVPPTIWFCSVCRNVPRSLPLRRRRIRRRTQLETRVGFVRNQRDRFSHEISSNVYSRSDYGQYINQVRNELTAIEQRVSRRRHPVVAEEEEEKEEEKDELNLMWQDFQAAKSRASSASEEKEKVTDTSTELEIQANALFAEMNQARIADQLSAREIAKLNLTRKIRTFFSSKTRAEKISLLHYGCLDHLRQWIQPLQHPRVTQTILNILLTLPITKEQAKQGLAKQVLQYCTEKDQTIENIRQAQRLIQMWSSSSSSSSTSSSSDTGKDAAREYIKECLMKDFRAKRVSRDEFKRIAQYVTRQVMTGSNIFENGQLRESCKLKIQQWVARLVENRSSFSTYGISPSSN